MRHRPGPEPATFQVPEVYLTARTNGNWLTAGGVTHRLHETHVVRDCGQLVNRNELRRLANHNVVVRITNSGWRQEGNSPGEYVEQIVETHISEELEMLAKDALQV